MTQTDATSRPEGQGYIDEAVPSTLDDLTLASDNDQASGSSVEQESEDDGSLAEHPIPAERARLEDFAFLDQRQQGDDQAELESEESDWDVDDEDWELANGGESFFATVLTVDFTKQYNRLRQQHNAQTPQSGPSSSRLDQRPTAPSRAPLPARNTNATRETGVALNPKSTARSSKDKSDRATQEQVLDPRTRLVLSGLVNRGVVGEIERCISTGKEVGLGH